MDTQPPKSQLPKPLRSSNMFGLTPVTDDFLFTEPENNVDDTDEKRKKRISKSKQWKETKEYLEGRKKLYTKQLPGGPLFRNMTREDAGYYAGIADCVIEEIDGFIAYIDGVM